MKTYRSDLQVLRQRPLFTGTVIVLFLTMLMFGCATAPGADEAPDTAAAVPEDSEPRVVPEPEPESGFRTVHLLSRETTFLGDGRLDSYRELTYEPAGTGLLQVLDYDANERLVQARLYELDEGLPAEERLYDQENQLRAIRRYEYDWQGNLTMEEQLDAAEEFQTRSTYGYDAEGRRTSWQVFSSFAGLMGSTAYSYDDDKLTRIDSLSPSGDLEEYFVIEFDEQGYPSQRTHFDARDRRLSYVQYNYVDGTLERETVRRPTGAEQRSVSYEYDQAGNIVVENHYDAAGNLRERIEREFITREVQE